MSRGDLSVSEFPNGVRFWLREDTCDHNTAYSTSFEDEYGLFDLDVKGWLVFDGGAYIGSVGVTLAKRGARVVCVEPVPANAEMVRRNAQLNGVEVTVVEAAAGWPGTKIIRWGFEPEPGWNDLVASVPYLGYTHDDQIKESISHHQFIGNSNNMAPMDQTYVETEVSCVGLDDMIERFDTPDAIKIDCEGGEWPWLASENAWTVPLWVGEWHPWGDEDPEGSGSFRGRARHGRYGREMILDRLGKTHVVSFTGPEGGPGGFRATLR